MKAECPLCEAENEDVIAQSVQWRVVLVNSENWPGYCRVIWHDHVSEMSDLPEADRMTLMEIVFAVETAIREVMHPHKINLACLGNQVPHLHWHIIPRFEDDTHFPDSIWANARREADANSLYTRKLLMPSLRFAVAMACETLGGL